MAKFKNPTNYGNLYVGNTTSKTDFVASNHRRWDGPANGEQ